MDPAPARPPDPAPCQWLVRCKVCGRTLALETGAVLQFVHGGGLCCCGEVMALYIEVRNQAPD